MHQKTSEKIYERVVKCFLDLAIMTKLRDGNPMSGYDVITFVHEKFATLLSSGTVYSVLYFMESNGLVNGKRDKRVRTCRVYKLTDKGEKTIKVVLNLVEEIQNTVRLLISSNSEASKPPSQ